MVVIVSVFSGLENYFPILKHKPIKKDSLSSRAYAKERLFNEFRMVYFAAYFLGAFYVSSWVVYALGLYGADPFPLVKGLFYIYIAIFAVKFLFYGACLLKTYIIKSDSGD